MYYYTKSLIIGATALIALLFQTISVHAANKSPLPRFAITKSSEVNARTGPGVRYPTNWVFIKKGEPLKITAEFEQWRYVHDIKGDVGWVHSSVLSGKRSAIVIGDTIRNLRISTDAESRIVAKLQPDLRCALKHCKAEWCKLKCDSYSGWVPKKYLWGIFPDEVF